MRPCIELGWSRRVLGLTGFELLLLLCLRVIAGLRMLVGAASCERFETRSRRDRGNRVSRLRILL